MSVCTSGVWETSSFTAHPIYQHSSAEEWVFTSAINPFSQNPWRIPKQTLHTLIFEGFAVTLASSVTETTSFPSSLRLSIPSSCKRIFFNGGFGTSKINSCFSGSRNFCSSLSSSWKVNKRKSNKILKWHWRSHNEVWKSAKCDDFWLLFVCFN